jgi:hypothetical protein
MHGGVIEPQPLRPLALLLAGALSEACFYVADADDPAQAREEVGRLVVRILEGLQRRPENHVAAEIDAVSERGVV